MRAEMLCLSVTVVTGIAKIMYFFSKLALYAFIFIKDITDSLDSGNLK